MDVRLHIVLYDPEQRVLSRARIYKSYTVQLPLSRVFKQTGDILHYCELTQVVHARTHVDLLILSESVEGGQHVGQLDQGVQAPEGLGYQLLHTASSLGVFYTPHCARLEVAYPEFVCDASALTAHGAFFEHKGINQEGLKCALSIEDH